MNTKKELEKILRENLLGIKPTMLFYEDDLPKILGRVAQAILDKLPELVETDVDELGREIYTNGHMGFDEARMIAKAIKQKGIIKIKEE